MQHARMKPKATTTTAEEERHVKRVRDLGCLVCGLPAHAHHVMHAPGKRRRRDDRFVVPLCQAHHQGNEGVHRLGSEKAFEALWGVDLVMWCLAAWNLRDRPEHSFWRDGVTRCRVVASHKLMEHKKAGGERRRTNNCARPALAQPPTVGGD